MEFPILGTQKILTTSARGTSSISIWSAVDNFSDEEKYEKESSFTQASIKIDKLEQDPDYIHFFKYMEYLESLGRDIKENQYEKIFSLHRSMVLAKKYLKYGYFDPIHLNKKSVEDVGTAIILRMAVSEKLSGLLMYGFMESAKLINSEKMKSDDKEKIEKFTSFWPDEILEGLNKELSAFETDEKKEKYIKEKIYFISVVATALWTKSGTHEAYTYLTAYYQALYSNQEGEILRCKYESNKSSWVEQDGIIAVPYAAEPAIFIEDAADDYKYKYRSKSNLTIDESFFKSCNRAVIYILNKFNDKDNDIVKDYREIIEREQSEGYQKLKSAKSVRINRPALPGNVLPSGPASTQSEDFKGISVQKPNRPSVFRRDFDNKYKEWIASSQNRNSEVLHPINLA